MRTGYLALFGMVMAYSAYEGVGVSGPVSRGANSGMQGTSEQQAELRRVAGLAPGAEAFPTIPGGICSVEVKGVPSPTCGECKPICPAKGLSDLIEDYFRAETGKEPVSSRASHWKVPAWRRSEIKVVIASVPDPVHTHMALSFDRSIETIQRAAQASHYLFSRAWMPWDSTAHTESADFTVRMAQTKYRDEVEALPGLMIFQISGSKDGPGRILFVFVVGETPTGGIHIEQFQNALKIREAILRDTKTDEGKVLRIFGPAFSGSLLSLHAVLNALNHDQFSSIVVRSGTVSSFHAVHDFCESTYRDWKAPAGRPDFATFQFSDKYEEYYVNRFFSDRNGRHSNIAILSEDETALGNQERSSLPSDENDACGKEPKEEPKQPAQDGDANTLRLYFPREIAQLRDAYQRDVKVAAGDGAKLPAQPGLPLSLSVTGNDDDSVAPYSPMQTPLSQESILQSIIATLRRRHAKVVVIRATDPLDVFFLSRYLRQNYPQARLVTAGEDLLMIHDLYDPRFHGILAVAAYPLLNGIKFPALQSVVDQEKDQEIHRLFSDSYSAGQYNAVLSLLAPAVESKTVLPAADYTQFGLPSFLEERMKIPSPWRAHLWMTAVGKEGYWPVAVLDDNDPRTPVAADIAKATFPDVDAASEFWQPPFAVHFSIGWMMLWSLAFGLTCVLSSLLLFPRPFSRSEILARFSGSRSTEHSGLLFAGCLLALAAQTLFLFPSIIWFGSFRGPAKHWEDVITGLILVSVCFDASVVALGIGCAIGFYKRGNKVLAWIGAATCATAVLLSVLLTNEAWPAKQGTQLASFVYRYMQVGSGVSPCLPLLFLLAAGIWWCWQSLTGVASTEEKHMILPDLGDFDRESPINGKGSATIALVDAPDRVRLKPLSQQANLWLWKALKTMPLGRKWKILWVAVTGIAVIYLWMRPDEIAEAFESKPYRVMYWILLYLSLFLICYLVVHIVVLWLEFRTLLRAIDRLPFRRGFTDIKSLTWKPLWKLAGNGRQDFVQVLGGELDALRQIQNRGMTYEGLKKTIADALSGETEVSAEYEKMSSRKPNEDSIAEVQRLFENLQGKLAKAAAEGLIYASQQWKKQVYEPPAESESKDSEGKKITLQPARDVMTRAVEHFLCLFYVNVILVPLRRLQTLILALAGVFVFVSLSYSSYPFESRESFHALLIGIFFAISIVVGIVYGQVYANPLLSLITNTEPGELGLDFWVKIGSFVFIPLLSLVSVQFPEINSFLFSWLQPALQSIK